jgi:hypothetical protein
MTRFVSRYSFAMFALVAAACGESAGSVLEQIPENDGRPGPTDMPPETRLQMDVFVIRDIESCAMGDPCVRSSNPDVRSSSDCFEFEDASGGRIGFRGESLYFLRPDDLRVTQDAFCFHLGIDDETWGSLDTTFDELRNRVFDASGGEILLDVVPHSIDSMLAAFVRYENEWGIFLETDALESYADALTRETDFVMAINGSRDLSTGYAPLVEHCAGTNRELRDGLAGAGYTWLTTECVGVNTLLRHWMFQVGVALRDANSFNDLYDRDYPPCGEGSSDPYDWWPNPDECSVDPDAPTCGDDRCEGTDDDYVEHVLTDHWQRGRDFVGNRCRNGRADFDELDVDVGGACELLSE